MELLARRYNDLDIELEQKKKELGAKLAPLFEQFLDETGLPVHMARVHYLELTSVGDDIRKYMVAGIRLKMEDVENTIVIKGTR
jgi:hypothetical protein